MSGQHPEHADAADADVEARVIAAPDATGEPYEIVACDPAPAHTAAFCAEVTRRTQLTLGGGSRSIKVLCPPRALRAMPNVSVVEGSAQVPLG